MGQTERQSERPVVNQIDKFLEQTDRVETDRESDRKVPGADRQVKRSNKVDEQGVRQTGTRNTKTGNQSRQTGGVVRQVLPVTSVSL